MNGSSDRRPIGARDTGWARRLAAGLAASRVPPDLISAGSMAFALLGGACLALSGDSVGTGRVLLLLLAIFAIQARLLCNMLDGMVAVEHGRGSPEGPVWNELPDRIADTLLLAGAGYGAAAFAPDLGPAVGWLSAVLAVMTAYVRELGRSAGFPYDFSGLLAKPRRMFVLTVASLAAVFEPAWGWRGESLFAGLIVVAALTAATVWTRTRRLAAALRARGS